MEKLNYYQCSFTCPERGNVRGERELTIVQGTDKTDAGHRAIRKMKRAIGKDRARHYDLWSVNLIATTF